MFRTLILIVCLLALFYVVRILWLAVQQSLVRNEDRKERQARLAWVKEHPFRAVSCEGHCPEVKALQGQRFLDKDAPRFPLPGCNAPRCECRYVHYGDRRSIRPDRRSFHGTESEQATSISQPERRTLRQRRATDLAWG